LKIALIIGNPDYDVPRVECPVANCSEKFKNYSSLKDIYNSMSCMKNELENLGFLVISFVNVSANDFNRALRLLKWLCEYADRVFALVYVAGHGHHCKNNDYLVPTDARHYYHINEHKDEHFLASSNECSLLRVLETFVEKNPQQEREGFRHEHSKEEKFTVRILWDLCRSFDDYA
jgi:uncharacterized caspase-like protein